VTVYAPSRHKDGETEWRCPPWCTTDPRSTHSGFAVKRHEEGIKTPIFQFREDNNLWSENWPTGLPLTSARDLLGLITAVECSYSCRLVSSFRSKARKTMEAGDDQIWYGTDDNDP